MRRFPDRQGRISDVGRTDSKREHCVESVEFEIDSLFKVDKSQTPEQHCHHDKYSDFI